jgi:hypothetical protein
MHFLFKLLRIKDLYMIRTLLAHPQEVLTSGTWYILRERYASWLHHDNPGAAN